MARRAETETTKGPQAKVIDQRPRKRLNSETIARLLACSPNLPRRRLRGLWLLLGLSGGIGVLDLVFVGLLARLVGTLSGARLADMVPNIFVFGGDVINHGFWVAGILILLAWLATVIKLADLGLQGLLTAQICSDYGERSIVMYCFSPYDYIPRPDDGAPTRPFNIEIFGRISDSTVLPFSPPPRTVCQRRYFPSA